MLHAAARSRVAEIDRPVAFGQEKAVEIAPTVIRRLVVLTQDLMGLEQVHAEQLSPGVRIVIRNDGAVGFEAKHACVEPCVHGHAYLHQSLDGAVVCTVLQVAGHHEQVQVL